MFLSGKISVSRTVVRLEKCPRTEPSFGEMWQNAEVATVLGSIPASSDTVETEGRQMKQCWIQYLEKNILKNLPVEMWQKLFAAHTALGLEIEKTAANLFFNCNGSVLTY